MVQGHLPSVLEKSDLTTRSMAWRYQYRAVENHNEYLNSLLDDPNVQNKLVLLLMLVRNRCNTLILDIISSLVYSSVNEGIFECCRDCKTVESKSCNSYTMGAKGSVERGCAGERNVSMAHTHCNL